MLGEKAEIKLTKNLNKNKTSEYWDTIGIIEKGRKYVHAIHITGQKKAKLIGKKVYPKADIALAKGKIPKDYLEENEYYLNEGDKRMLNLKYIKKTGISVKKPGSDRYTITKMNPSTFKEVFGSSELGAGASIYCRRTKDINKNIKVINGWDSTLDKFVDYFSFIKDISIIKRKDVESLKKKRIYRKIKRKSNEIIERKIKENKEIREFIFKGEHNFEEPFTAQWIYQDGYMEENGLIPFKVTTGSGRSRGDFTVVIKPQI